MRFDFAVRSVGRSYNALRALIMLTHWTAVRAKCEKIWIIALATSPYVIPRITNNARIDAVNVANVVAAVFVN